MGIVFLLSGRTGRIARGVLGAALVILGIVAEGGGAVVLIVAGAVIVATAAIDVQLSGPFFSAPWRGRDEPDERRY